MSTDHGPLPREEIKIEDFNKSIENWDKFFKKSNYVISTAERDIPLSNSHKTIQLLNHKLIKKHKQKLITFI